MTVDHAALETLRSTLAADDYHLTVTESGTEVHVHITAGPEACADCLVPKPLMRGVLQTALGVPEEQITVVYPGDAGQVS